MSLFVHHFLFLLPCLFVCVIQSPLPSRNKAYLNCEITLYEIHTTSSSNSSTILRCLHNRKDFCSWNLYFDLNYPPQNLIDSCDNLNIAEYLPTDGSTVYFQCKITDKEEEKHEKNIAFTFPASNHQPCSTCQFYPECMRYQMDYQLSHYVHIHPTKSQCIQKFAPRYCLHDHHWLKMNIEKQNNLIQHRFGTWPIQILLIPQELQTNIINMSCAAHSNPTPFISVMFNTSTPSPLLDSQEIHLQSNGYVYLNVSNSLYQTSAVVSCFARNDLGSSNRHFLLLITNQHQQSDNVPLDMPTQTHPLESESSTIPPWHEQGSVSAIFHHAERLPEDVKLLYFSTTTTMSNKKTSNSFNFNEIMKNKNYSSGSFFFLTCFASNSSCFNLEVQIHSNKSLPILPDLTTTNSFTKSSLVSKLTNKGNTQPLENDHIFWKIIPVLVLVLLLALFIYQCWIRRERLTRENITFTNPRYQPSTQSDSFYDSQSARCFITNKKNCKGLSSSSSWTCGKKKSCSTCPNFNDLLSSDKNTSSTPATRVKIGFGDYSWNGAHIKGGGGADAPDGFGWPSTSFKNKKQDLHPVKYVSLQELMTKNHYGNQPTSSSLSIGKLSTYNLDSQRCHYLPVTASDNDNFIIMTSSKFTDPFFIDFDRIQTTEMVGAGAFGQVNRGTLSVTNDAQSTTHFIEVAVKEIKGCHDRMEMQMLRKEITLLKSVSLHPNVIQFIGYSRKPMMNTLLLVMEFCSHGNLKHYLDSQNAFHFQSIDLLYQFCRQIIDGMIHISSHNVIHRDLAARNVLLTDKMICKISDFGLSRQLAVEEEYYKLVHSNLPLKWMAPEVMCERKFSIKSDVWSFGVLLWEIFSLGESPYANMEFNDIQFHLKNGYRLPKPHFASDHVYKVMRQCWSEESNQRPDFTTLAQLLA